MFRLIILTLCLGLSAPAFGETRVPQSKSEISLGFAPLVKQAAPAVANIYARRVVQAQAARFRGTPFSKSSFAVSTHRASECKIRWALA